MRGKHIIIGCLVAILIALLIYAPITTSQIEKQYDPWKDINDDGYIGIDDIVRVAESFGGLGDSTKNVTINHKVQLYNFSKVISPRGIVSFNISAAGFRQATIIIMANKSSPFYLEARTGFSVGKCYTFSSWFAVASSEQYITVPTPPSVEPQIWLDPTHIRIDSPQLGYKFNVTVKVSEK